MAKTHSQFFDAMLGGGNGGVNIASPCADGAYDFIMVESGVTLTVLEDSAGTDLLTAKNLAAVAFTSSIILNAGTGLKIKKLTFSGGLVWGYTFSGKQI
jgi:hypothetical protein